MKISNAKLYQAGRMEICKTCPEKSIVNFKGYSPCRVIQSLVNARIAIANFQTGQKNEAGEILQLINLATERTLEELNLKACKKFFSSPE